MPILDPVKRKAWRAIWLAKNREKLKAQRATYRVNRRDLIQEAAKVYRRENAVRSKAYRETPKVRAYQAQYREAHKDKMRLYQAAYREAHRKPKKPDHLKKLFDLLFNPTENYTHAT